MILNKNLDKDLWFKNRIIEVFGHLKYIPKESYINTSTKINVECDACKRVFGISPRNLLQGYGCSRCSRKEKKDISEIEKIVNSDIGGYNFISCEKYNNVKSKMTVKHNFCGHVYDVSINNFVNNGKRCPKCFKPVKKTNEDVQKGLDIAYPNEYILKSDYVNKDSKVKVLHKVCGNVSEFTYNNIRNKKFSCKKCKMSSGERAVEKILKEENIEFEYQKKFERCKHFKLLPFDFYFELNGVKCIIEYDGRQHHLPIFGDGEEDRSEKLKLTQKRDRIKNNFCKENEINLLRIRYDENIEEKLHNFLMECRMIGNYHVRYEVGENLE